MVQSAIRRLIGTVLGLACAGVAYAAPLPPAHCEHLKLVAAAKAAADILRCHAAAAGAGIAPRSACLSGATARLASAFGKAESKSVCAFTAEVASVVTALRGHRTVALRRQEARCSGQTCAGRPRGPSEARARSRR